jgi:hypothetical protein
MILNKYKIYCLTEAKFEFTDYRDAELPLPTTCPADPNHTCDPESVTIVHTVDTDANKVVLDEAKTSAGMQKVAIYEPEGDASTVVSHNFADPCSWYQGAVQVVAGALTNTTGNTYADPQGKTNWIDLEHGRLYNEDTIMSRSNDCYKVRVYVDGVLQTTGITIDYVAGTVTFASPVTGVVTASYWYSDKSYYGIRPTIGKTLAIKATEIQFSTNTIINCPFVFEPWFVGHPTYGTMPVPGQRIAYKNARDFISAANQGQGIVQKWGELTQDVMVFPFLYARPKAIRYSDCIEIRIYTKDHLPVGGEYATGTFYVTIDDETVPTEGEQTMSVTAENLQLQIDQRAITKCVEYTFTEEKLQGAIIELFSIPANARILDAKLGHGPLAVDVMTETAMFSFGLGAGATVPAAPTLFASMISLGDTPNVYGLAFGMKCSEAVPLILSVESPTVDMTGKKLSAWVTYVQE